jgi:adenylylsulfate kinase
MEAFVVWLTGLPASGKSAIAACLAEALGARGAKPVTLESDVLRATWSERPSYDELDREYFYGAVAFIAETLAGRGIPVIIDATAHRRAYRERVRKRVQRFLEVFVACPIEVCARRDPKGLYRSAIEDPNSRLPGIGVEYEAPQCPDVIVHSDYERPDAAAQRIVETLVARGFSGQVDSEAGEGKPPEYSSETQSIEGQPNSGAQSETGTT